MLVRESNAGRWLDSDRLFVLVQCTRDPDVDAMRRGRHSNRHLEARNRTDRAHAPARVRTSADGGLVACTHGALNSD